MKRKRVNAKRSSVVPSKNLLHKKTKKRKGLKIVSLLIGIGIVVSFLLLTVIQPTVEALPEGGIAVGYNFLTSETPTPTLAPPTPTPTALIPSDDFVFYSQLSGEEKFAVAYTFTDPVLKTSFAYPPGYYMQAIKAENNNTYRYANVFFAKNGDADAIKGIRYVVGCILDNRRIPSGLCRESQVRDIEVSIHPYKVNVSDFSETENCRKEIDEKERILMSCVGPMSIDMRDRGMSYTLYLLGENPISVSLSVREPKVHAHIIRSILSSATSHAQ